MRPPPIRPLVAAAVLLTLAGGPARAQSAVCAADAGAACAAFRALTGAALPADSASAQPAAAWRRADAVLLGGAVDTLAIGDSLAAFGWAVGAERRVVAVNTGAAWAFVELPGPGVPSPLVAVFVSRADAGPVPSLVALLDDDRATYGLRVPARSAVVYRPATPHDVRPRGLDE